MVGLTFSSTYTCSTITTSNKISVNDFVSTTISAKTTFSFTLDSIISPGSLGVTKAISISTIDKDSNLIDTGQFAIPSGYFTTGTVT